MVKKAGVFFLQQITDPDRLARAGQVVSSSIGKSPVKEEKPSHRLLLRAELTYGAARIVTHTLEISRSLVLVQTDEDAYVGDKVMASFSFPGLVEPFSVETQVIARNSGIAAGQVASWTLGFVLYNEGEQTRLHRLLGQLQNPAERPTHQPYRVLVVEDNELTRQAFALGAARFLGDDSAGITLDVVSDGREAWRVLHESSYDLAIVDYGLPLLSGDRLIAKLRRDSGLARLPIFAISVGGAEAREVMLSAGEDLFLPKPLVLRDLFATLRWLTSPPRPPVSSDGSLHRAAS